VLILIIAYKGGSHPSQQFTNNIKDQCGWKGKII